MIALDIETNYAHDTIWCVVTKNEKEETKVFLDKEGLQDYLDGDEVSAHNGIAFDFYLLEKLWGITIPEENQVDTLILSRLLKPARIGGHSLAAWGDRLKQPKLDNAEIDFDGGLTYEMITYCKGDVETLWVLTKYLTKELAKWKNSQQSIELEYKVQRIIHQQKLNGFKLDEQHASCYLGEVQSRMGMIEAELQEVFPPIVTERYSEKTGKRLKDNVEVFNVGSRQQIAKRLTPLGAKFTETTEKGSPIVNEPVLEGIDLPEAKLCLEYLTLQKRASMVSSWLDKLGGDGRVHGGVITNGAVTGRMTHNSPNMGQITSEKESRAAWIVDEGNLLVGIDLSGIELRCLAHYMKDEEWTKELLEGDIHTKNQLAAGLPERAQAKTMIYATLYGAGTAKIGSIVGGGTRDGKRILDNFYENTPALVALKEKVAKHVTKNGYLTALDGRRLEVRSEHSALNTLLQSCGAVVAKQWLVELWRLLELSNLAGQVKQVAMVHDEVQLEVPANHAEEVGKLAVEAALLAGTSLGFSVPVDAEYKIGKDWSETH